jgi:Ca-activated chloride channel family protein
MRCAGLWMTMAGLCVLAAGCGRADSPEAVASSSVPLSEAPGLPAPVATAVAASPAMKSRAAKDESGFAQRPNSEQYVDHGVRPWMIASKDALSTFAIDVDTASYTIARRKLREGALPPPESVRLEEFVNYFRYDYPQPEDGAFRVDLEASPSPFDADKTVLKIGIQGKSVHAKEREPVHLTFLVDTSGSMHSDDKLGLVKRSLRFLVDQLHQGDTVALSTYAGSVREVLAPTAMSQRASIHEAIEGLSAGGSTAMSSGLELAYRLATQNAKSGVNRVIVCSDGDANVGATAHGDMLSSIAKYAADGITLSTIGFGMGNYKDHEMEQLADKGNGNYYYIDTISQAKRVFGEQLMGTLQVIAQDVKVQVEFDPKLVEQYRLLGYENRHVANEDFRNDKVDAGEIGAGHSVTALYEVKVRVPKSKWATVRIRWKQPGGGDASETELGMSADVVRSSFEASSAGFRRAVAAAALAENLRQSQHAKVWTIEKARAIAQGSMDRERPEELELLELIQKTESLMRAGSQPGD